MQIFHHLHEIPADFGPVVATIGNFDGVHRGHQWVMERVTRRAKELGLHSIAVTFDPHPARVLHPDKPHALITTLPQKLALLGATGVDAALVLPFTTALSQTSARAFATEVLANGLHAREVHEGDNFRFGYQAAADIEGLGELGRELGFAVQVYAPQILRGAPVSSSRIRALLREGRVSAARGLLGRSFAVESTPASGRGYGTRYTVPTINLASYDELLPANGVYITTLTIGAGENAEIFEAVTNVGNRPTFGVDSFTVESHLLNFHPVDLQPDTPLSLAFLTRLREERRFPSPEDLRAQILRDVARAQRYFSLCRRLGSPAPSRASTQG